VFVGVKKAKKEDLTLKGLMSAVKRSYSKIWGPAPLVDIECESGPFTDPVGVKFPPPPRFKAKPPTTHPATIQNVGRPPPTSVWGPDKPKQLTPAERKDLLNTYTRVNKETEGVGWGDEDSEDSRDDGRDDYYEDETDYGQEFDELLDGRN